MSKPNIQEINVGLNGAVTFKPIVIKQFDKNTRRIEITLLEGSDIYEIPVSSAVKFQATKQDGKIIFDDCDVEDGIIVYNVTEQLSTSVGTVKCEIGIYEPDSNGDTSKDGLLQSATFDILVEKSAMDRDAIISSDEFNTLTIMINTITGLVESATTILSEIEMAISNTETAIANTEVAINTANQATTESQQATTEAHAIVQEIRTDLDNGAFDGATWHTGSTIPSSSLGLDGDLYLDILSYDVYTKAGGTWTITCNIKGIQGDRGIDGEKGTIWITGVGIPDESLGRNGDYYLNSDQDANDVYEKVADMWVKKCNIRGESGVYISATDDVTPPDWANVWIIINNDPTSTIDGQLEAKLDKTGDAKDTIVTYSEPTNEEELASGNKLSTLIGRITKKLSLLKSGKIDKSSVVNNLLTTTDGTVLDGRVGKTLDDKIAANTNSINMVNNNLTTIDISDKLVANAGIALLNKNVNCTGNTIIIQCLATGLGGDVVADKPIATLDVAYRPAIGYNGFVYSYDGNGNNKVGIAYISSNGVVAISLWSAAYTYNRIQIQMFK